MLVRLPFASPRSVVQEPDRIFASRRGEVHIPLCGAQVGVAREFLDCHCGCCPHRQVRAERVPQDMEVSVHLEPRPTLSGRSTF